MRALQEETRTIWPETSGGLAIQPPQSAFQASVNGAVGVGGLPATDESCPWPQGESPNRVSQSVAADSRSPHLVDRHITVPPWSLTDDVG